MTREKAPHVAILNVQVEVCALDPLGQCSGKVVSNEELRKEGIDNPFLLRVDGWDKQDCINKLLHKLDEFRYSNTNSLSGEPYGQ